MAVIHELTDENPEVLTGDSRNAAVIRAVSGGTVASRASLEQLCAVRDIRLGA
jgi:hypothetical protein